jgi:hypothetical protein
VRERYLNAIEGGVNGLAKIVVRVYASAAESRRL